MKTTRPHLLVGALLFGALGCPEPASGPPGLFNAVDPSLQCPAGEIGWDFSTGGNTDGIRRNSVGNTIAITEATFGGSCQAGLAESFRSACDGYALCTLPVPGCRDEDVTLRYQCGTETATYQARIESGAEGDQITVSCGGVITVVNAIYAPDADQPADITNALAALCTGKRRCANGTSGYALNNQQDPQPNVAKTVQVTYVCDAEAREETVLVDDFKLDFYCDDTEAPPSSELEFLSIQTVIPRSMKTERCAGAHCTEQFYKGYEDKYAAWAAENFEGITAACEGKRDCEFSVRQMDHNERNTIYREIESSPDETDVMGIAMGPKELQRAYQTYYVGYTCGSDPQIIWKYLPIPTANAPKLKLKCGAEIQINNVYVNQGQYTAAQRQTFLEMLQTNCDGARVCYPPLPHGRGNDWYYDSNNQRRFVQYQRGSTPVNVEYSCGDLDFAQRYIATVDYSGYETHIECDAERDDVIARGIRINSVEPVSKTLEITKLCFGRDHCVLPGGQGDVAVTYRCGEGAQLQSISYSGLGNTGNRIECRPNARFVKRYVIDPAGNEYDFGGNICRPETYENRWVGPGGSFIPDNDGQGNYCYRWSPGPTCPMNLPYDSDGDGNNDASFNLCDVDEVHWDFQCGPDPSNIQTFTQVRGEGMWDDRFPVYPRWIENVTCEPPLTPYVNKKCVSKTCLGQTRRGDELQCETDTSLVPVFSYAAPVVKNYQSNPDGTPARWGGTEAIEDGVTTLRSGYPYQLFPLVSYQSPGGADWAIPDNTDVTTWSYDVFHPRDPSDAPAGAEVFGFRCLVNSTSIESAYKRYAGYWQVFAGGSPTTIPDACYGHDEVKSNDPSTSWYNAAKRANLTESEFKQKYQRVSSRLVSSLDAGAKNTVRWIGGSTYWSPNPIGFFYDPARDYIDTMAFYGQTGDFQNQKTVSFVESKQIEIASVRQSVVADAFFIDVNDPELVPNIAVNFSWSLRGDNAKNPYSPESQASTGSTLSLGRDNLRAVVEIAYSDDTNTSWAPVSAARFSASQPLNNHNVYFQTETIQLTVSQLMRTRMMTVRGNNATLGERPDGWMSRFDDEDTVFKIRTCLISDDFPFVLGGDDTATPSQSSGDYSLRLSKRCTEPNQLVLKRELFVTPEPVAASGAAETEAATMGGNGDAETSSTADNGTQSNCTIQCTSNADCGGGTCSADGRCMVSPDNQRCASENRSGSASGVGSVKLTLYSNRTDNGTRTEGGQTTSSTSNVTELLGFQVMNVAEQAQAAIEGAVSSYHFTLDIGLNLATILEYRDRVKKAPQPKALFSFDLKDKKGKFEGRQLYGVQFVIQAQYNFTIGPFPLTVIFSFTVALIPHLTLDLAGGRFTAPSDNPALNYPCFVDANGDGTKCYVAESAALSFPEARQSCGAKGGRLATVYGNEQATAIAAVTEGAASEHHWIGAVPQYLYQYSPCADVGTPQATPIPAGVNCAERSLTQYTWLTADRGAGSSIAFARQAGVGTTFSSVTLPSGLSMTPARSYVAQGLAGVYYQKSTGNLGHRPRTDQLRYVCEYDPASVVKANRQDISISLEVMAALSIEVCTPSGDFGICLNGTLKFFTADIKFGITLSRADIYGSHPNQAGLIVPWTTLSGTTLYGKLSASAIAVEFAAILRFIFWDTSITIKKIDPVASWEKVLFEIPNHSYQSHLESR